MSFKVGLCVTPGSVAVLEISFVLILNMEFGISPLLSGNLIAASDFHCLVVWAIGSPQEEFLMNVPSLCNMLYDIKDTLHNPLVSSHAPSSVWDLIPFSAAQIFKVLSSQNASAPFIAAASLWASREAAVTSSLHLSWHPDTSPLWSCSLLMVSTAFSSHCVYCWPGSCFFFTHSPSFIYPCDLGLHVINVLPFLCGPSCVLKINRPTKTEIPLHLI